MHAKASASRKVEALLWTNLDLESHKGKGKGHEAHEAHEALRAKLNNIDLQFLSW